MQQPIGGRSVAGRDARPGAVHAVVDDHRDLIHVSLHGKRGSVVAVVTLDVDEACDLANTLLGLVAAFRPSAPVHVGDPRRAPRRGRRAARGGQVTTTVDGQEPTGPPAAYWMGYATGWHDALTQAADAGLVMLTGRPVCPRCGADGPLTDASTRGRPGFYAAPLCRPCRDELGATPVDDETWPAVRPWLAGFADHGGAR